MGACTPKDRYGQEASRFGGSDALWRNSLISEIHPKIDHADVENSLIRSVDDARLFTCPSACNDESTEGPNRVLVAWAVIEMRFKTWYASSSFTTGTNNAH